MFFITLQEGVSFIINEMLSDVGGGGGDCSGRTIFFIFIKENLISATTRSHAESNINLLLTKNLLINSGFRQRSHFLMIPLHCLWAKSNNRTRGQFECDVLSFVFVLF